MKKLSSLEWVVMILVIVGSLDWGLMAINWDWNLVEMVFGTQGVLGTLGRLVYGLVGLSGVYLLYWLTK